jgi:hypothetical protein
MDEHFDSIDEENDPLIFLESPLQLFLKERVDFHVNKNGI